MGVEAGTKPTQETPTSEIFLDQLFESAPSSILEDWKNKLYTEIPSVFTQERFESLNSLFADFCKQVPDEVKENIRIYGENGRGTGSLGYVRRHPNGESRWKTPEDKQYIQYNPKILLTKSDEIKNGGEMSEKLFRELDIAWQDALKLAKEFVARLEKENPQYGDLSSEFFPEGKIPRLTLRLLSYNKVEDGKLSANPHKDGGGLTFSLNESSPGLFVGFTEEEIKNDIFHLISRPSGTTLVWPGTNFDSIDPKIGGTWHGVAQTEHVKGEIGTDVRSAFVFFLDKYNEPIPSIEKTHGLK